MKISPIVVPILIVVTAVCQMLFAHYLDKQETIRHMTTDRIGRYIGTMERHHGELRKLANDYIDYIRHSPDEFKIASINKRMRQELSTLRQNKDNWKSLMDASGKRVITEYLAVVGQLDDELRQRHDKESLPSFINAFIAFEEAVISASSDIERQFFDITNARE